MHVGVYSWNDYVYTAWAYLKAVHGCQVNIGIPENGHPGCPFSRKYRHPDAHIYVNKQSIAAYAL